MAKSRAQIITDINNRFVTNGNISAVETNTTLKDILECIELNDKGDLVGIENRLNSVESVNGVQNSRLNALEQNNGNNQGLFSIEIPVQDSFVDAFFSFRGIQSHFVNITFRIRVAESFQGSIIFSSNQLQELKSLLEGIINYDTNQMLNFLVSVTNSEAGSNFFRIATVALYFVDDTTLGIRIKNYQNEPSGMQSGDEIYTSIALHSQYNDITGKIAQNLKIGTKGFEDLIKPKGNPNDNPKDTPKDDPKGIVMTPPKDKAKVTQVPEKNKTASTSAKTMEVQKTSTRTKTPPKEATAKTPIKKQSKTATKPKAVTKNSTKPTPKK